MRIRLPLLLLPLTLSAVAWVVVFASFPPPYQSFPLIDEWAFGQEAIDFARGAGVHYDGWASMPLLGLWLWSAPFVAALGHNLFVLRLSTIVLGWLGLIALDDLLRQLKIPAWQAAFATAAFALNPIFFLSQGTYMTDVPAVSFALIALCLYGRAMQRDNGICLAAATLAAILGVVTRQHVIAAPVTAGIVLAQSPQLRRRPAWWAAIALPVVIGVMTHVWFVSRKDSQPMPPEAPTLFRLAFTPWFILHTLGLATLPVLLLDPWPRSWLRFGTALAIALGIAFFWYRHSDYFIFDGLYPYTSGYVDPHGVYCMVTGAMKTDEMLTLHAEVLLTLLGCIGAAALVDRLPQHNRDGELLMVFGLLQTIPLFLTRSLYDRYVILLIPTALYVALSDRVPAPAWWRLRRLPAELAVILFAFVSLGMMHDWLAWNKARWELGRRALERGIHPWDIEGGFEWNGFYAPRPVPRRRPEVRRKREMIILGFTAEQFHHVRGVYALSFSVLPHTTPIDAEPFRLWLKRGLRQFYLVELIPGTRFVARAKSP